MTPGDIVLYARQQYNAVGDTFFTDSELFTMIWGAQMELARECECIRRNYSGSTVAGQQTYSKPANALAIKRITYNGQKLMKITDRQDDSLTLYNQVTTTTGVPQYYWEWDTSIYLRPIPSDIGTLAIYTFDKPATVTSNSVLDVPDRYHLDLVNHLLQRMAAKDTNLDKANIYGQMWAKNIADAKRYERKFIRGDAFSSVVDEASYPVTVVGAF